MNPSKIFPKKKKKKIQQQRNQSIKQNQNFYLKSEQSQDEKKIPISKT